MTTLGGLQSVFSVGPNYYFVPLGTRADRVTADVERLTAVIAAKDDKLSEAVG